MDALVAMFWREHTPMPSSFSGTQYRSAIFAHDASQREAAERVRASLLGDSPFASSIHLTAIEDAGPFFRAEEYHQKFLAKAMGTAAPA